MDENTNEHGWTTAVIRQEDGTADCVACVAAMAAGTTVAEFKAWCGQAVGPFSDLTVIAWLLRHGVQMGTGFGGYAQDNPALYPAAEFRWDFEGNAAYLGVKSERFEGCGHAVFWNGERVLDPGHDESQPKRRYRIETIWPLYRLPPQECPDPALMVRVPETRTVAQELLDARAEIASLRERVRLWEPRCDALTSVSLSAPQEAR